MRRRLITALLAAPLLAGATPAPMTVGVSVHFGQGWAENRWDMLAASNAPLVREALGWRLVESKRRQYSFTAETSGHLDRLCATGRKVVLVTLMHNPLYDGGKTVYTGAGRSAFAAYLGTVAKRYAGCLAAIEIGNEINIRPNMTGIAASDRPTYYTAILAAVYPAIKAAAPDVAVLGGSTNVIGTGFLESLAAAGMLDHVDGIAVHPYRQDPANVDWELERLATELAAYGPARPVWATEFSKDFAAGEDSAGFFARMVTLMSAAGVTKSVWYALADQPAFPTMGLYTTGGARKPAGDAYAYFTTSVLPRGPAVRQGSDPTLFHYRFGSDRQIVWGAPRTLTVTGSAVARDSRGSVVPLPTTVSETPVIIEGPATLAFGPSAILADSLTGYGRAPWSYWGKRGKNPEVALGPTDWNWTSFIANPAMRPAVLNQAGLISGGFGAYGAVHLTTRYTAPGAGEVTALACLRPKVAATDRSDGIGFVIAVNGAVVATASADNVTGISRAVPLRLAAGDRVDFTVSPNLNPFTDVFAYRFQIGRPGVEPPAC